MTLTAPRPVADAKVDARRRMFPAHRAAFAALLIATGLLYLWNLGASGWANAFYSAAAQAGSQSWTAFLFGSSDAANAITVDKTPGALWVMSGSVRLFGLNPWLPALRWVLLIGSIGAAAVIAVGAHRLGRATVVVAAAALLFGLGAPAAYSVATVANAHHGPIPSAGPAGAASGPGPGPEFEQADNPELEKLLTTAHTRWAAAVVGSMTTASLQLKTGVPIMAIGGFSGFDNSPTLPQFQQYVAEHQVRYLVAGKMEGPQRSGGSASQITAWVQRHFASTDVGGTTVYDLASPAA